MDPDIRMVSGTSKPVMGVTAEAFIKELIVRARIEAEKEANLTGNAVRSITADHIKSVIRGEPRFDFLNKTLYEEEYDNSLVKREVKREMKTE